MKSRVITAIIILAVLIPLIWFSKLAFLILACALILIGTHEMLQARKNKKFSIISQGLIYLVNITTLLFAYFYSTLQLSLPFMLSIIFCIYLLLIIFDHSMEFEDISYLGFVSIFIILSANCAMYERSNSVGFQTIMYIIIVTVACDTGAFFVGSAMGKHKLAPRLSPKKSVEGLIGGLICAVIVGTLYCLLVDIYLPENTLIFVIASLLLGIGAVIGDLFFSSIKRANGIKDFSNFLPGHGGILDRIDSHLTNFIVFYLFISILSIFKLFNGVVL
ncbi:MAG: phosphatidate cytidylyltransferase [Bacilli bacterium]|jgi:phosphatidate cytidylyltransferase|nr:phosphatidate cytidylyltransferase [Bacilli bacterium]